MPQARLCRFGKCSELTLPPAQWSRRLATGKDGALALAMLLSDNVTFLMLSDMVKSPC